MKRKERYLMRRLNKSLDYEKTALVLQKQLQHWDEKVIDQKLDDIKSYLVRHSQIKGSRKKKPKQLDIQPAPKMYGPDG